MIVMTPKEHIDYAADLLGDTYISSYNREVTAQYATIALAHIEMAKWKEAHEEGTN